MTKLFDFNSSQGSLKDQVSGTVPTNTNVVIKNSIVGRSAYFSNAQLDTGLKASVQTQDFCVECWLKVGAGATGSNRAIIANGFSYNLSRGWMIGMQNSEIRIWNGQPHVDFNMSSYFNKTVHLVLEKNGTSGKIYLNNVLVVSGTLPETITYNDSNLVIGNRFDGVNWNYDDNITRVKIYDTMLTTQEREALYQEFLHSYTQQAPLIHFIESSPASNDDIFFYDNGLNWNADGVTQTSKIADYNIDSGSFSIIEAGVGGDNEVLGSELVTNGTFDTDITGWTLGGDWSYNATTQDLDASSTSNNTFQTVTGFNAKKLFKVSFEIKTSSGGSIAVRTGGGSPQNIISNTGIVGVYTSYFINVSGSNVIVLDASSFTGSIDNVSIREVISPIEKQLVCITSGDISFKRVDLSELVGGGTLKEIEGSLEVDKGLTVDASSNFSWANNILTFAMTAGQTLRKILIKRGA